MGSESVNWSIISAPRTYLWVDEVDESNAGTVICLGLPSVKPDRGNSATYGHRGAN